jgi:hypothetical protein
VLADLTARSKALGATLTAEDDRVYIAALQLGTRDYSAN